MQSASFSSVCRLWKSEGPWPPATGSLKLLTGKLHTQCTHAQVLGNSRSSLLTALTARGGGRSLTRPASTLLLTLQSYHPQVSDPQHGQPLNMTCGKKRISQNNFKKQKQIGRLLFKSQAPIIQILKDAIFFLNVSLLFSIQKIMTHLF